MPYLCFWTQKQTSKINLRKGYAQFWYPRCSSNITWGWEPSQFPSHKNEKNKDIILSLWKAEHLVYLVSLWAWVWPHFGMELGKPFSTPSFCCILFISDTMTAAGKSLPIFRFLNVACDKIEDWEFQDWCTALRQNLGIGMLHIEFNASFLSESKLLNSYCIILPRVPYWTVFIECLLSQSCFIVLTFPHSDNRYETNCLLLSLPSCKDLIWEQWSENTDLNRCVSGIHVYRVFIPILIFIINISFYFPSYSLW